MPGKMSDQSQLPFQDANHDSESKEETIGRVVRVLPDVGGVDRPFDYLVPSSWMADGRDKNLQVGSRVRIPFGPRRVAGWVVEDYVDPPKEVKLRELTKISGMGPNSEMIQIARWVSYRWAGKLSSVLKTASPLRNIDRLPASPPDAVIGAKPPIWAIEALEKPKRVLRMPPNEEIIPLIKAAIRTGNALVIVPSIEMSKSLTGDLKKIGIPVSLMPHQWAEAAAGGVVIGTRSAVFAPVRKLAAILIFDEHNETLQEERMPTWHAREVAIERARRAEVPCVLISPTPSLEALQWGELQKFPKNHESESWAEVQIIDRREENHSRPGLLSDALVPLIRAKGEDPTICILNRKGRSRLLACSHCGELVKCEDHQVPLIQDEDEMLLCTVDGARQPSLCIRCGSTRFKNLRAGISRLREEIEALARQSTVEITSETKAADVAGCKLFIGTEAALHRFEKASQVIFLDFDQELLARRFRANEQALSLLAQASRLVGPKGSDGKIVIQTRQPDHEVLQAAVNGDPELLSESEKERRRILNLPPFSAQAEISGASAEIFMNSLGKPEGIQIMGPRDGSWLVQAPNSEDLAELLHKTERPSGRLRIQVDPQNI